MAKRAADFTYSATNGGMFIAILPANDRAVAAWNQLASMTDGTGKVLAHQFGEVRAALKRAGYTIAKAPKVKAGDLDAILAELDM